MNIGLSPGTVLLALAIAACSSATQGTPAEQSGAAPASVAEGSASDTSVGLVPAGYGTLRQEEVAIRVQLPAILVRALPLDESVIRLLSPDSYGAMRDLVEARRDAIARLAARNNIRQPSLWYVAFYGLEPEARFSPREILIQSAGRDYRPVDVIPLTAGFGEQRLRQRETQSAILVFDEGINVNLPLTVTIEGVSDASWTRTLRAIERERAVIRSRVQQRPNP